MKKNLHHISKIVRGQAMKKTKHVIRKVGTTPFRVFMNSNKNLVGMVVMLMVLATIGGVGLLSVLTSRPIASPVARFLYIDADDDFDSICVKMKRDLGAGSLAGFRLLGACTSYKEHIHTGAYSFSSAHHTLRIFRDLRAGHQTPVKMVVPSVRTIPQLIARVAPQIMADSTELQELLNDSVYVDKLGFNAQTLPALFIPNTYEVYWNMNAKAFVRRMHREYEVYWNKARRAKAKELKLDPIEVSILASIVEEETANNEEKPRVAGLYWNRLQRGIPLQADPTIKFSLKDFSLRRILFKHLEVESPYNTYKHVGLPPGPIRIPSVVGLNSVLNREEHKYIYMCAKEDFSGTHNFARTLSQHNANARRYQQALNKRKIK